MKRFISILLVAMMLVPSLCSLPLSSDAAQSWDWQFDGETLYITGTGALPSFRDVERPWDSFAREIRRIVVCDGITRIGDGAFSSIPFVTEIVLGKNVYAIGFDAFAYCGYLESIVFNGAIKSVSQGSVYSSDDISSVTVTGQTREQFLAIAERSPYNDAYRNAVNFIVQETAGETTVPEPQVEPTCLFGDVNGDGSVNKKDSLALKLHLADDSNEIDERAADVAYDGAVNKKDSLRLKQYLAGWEVEMGGEPEDPELVDEPLILDDTPYEMPDGGELALLDDGEAPGVPDGRNPSLAGKSGTYLLVFFDFTYRKAGLNLEKGTPISYAVTFDNGSTENGVAPLDDSVVRIKNKYGFYGVCFDFMTGIPMYGSAQFNLYFKDADGKEYTVSSIDVRNDLGFLGLPASEFEKELPDVETTVGIDTVIQKGNVNGTDFTFILDLSKWAGNTASMQIMTLAKLFWQVYPRMYERFGAAGRSPTTVTLAVENEGYGIAEAGGGRVHIHDKWLYDHPKDYDCITHELAHIIQNGWNGHYLETSGYIERFADACRFLYAYNNGQYNDGHWSLGTPDNESRMDSVRFLVWLDYAYSTEDLDLLLKFFTVCKSNNYRYNRWDEAWAEIFSGTDLAGKTADEAWDIFKTTDFAYLSTSTSGGHSSALLEKYDVRERLA